VFISTATVENHYHIVYAMVVNCYHIIYYNGWKLLQYSLLQRLFTAIVTVSLRYRNSFVSIAWVSIANCISLSHFLERFARPIGTIENVYGNNSCA